MAQDAHATWCDVWMTVRNLARVDETRTCTCGFRKRLAERNTRSLQPLGMSDADFLRTLKITPEEPV